VSHHDALRLRFVEVESGWMQRLADDTETIPLCYEDCSQLSSEERTTQFDQSLSGSAHLLGWANQSGGRARSPASDRIYLLSVVGSIINGQLGVSWSYSHDIHKRVTIESLAEQFLAELRLVISQCLSTGVESFTPSDFPEAGLDQSALDKLITRIDKSKSDKGRNVE